MIDERLYKEFRDIGRDIFVTGLTSSHGGNMSVRVGDKIIIKRRGAQFGRLKQTDFVETGMYTHDSGIMRASTELIVHRAIYEKTSALAIVHSHPRTAIVLSLSRDEIIPIDVYIAGCPPRPEGLIHGILTLYEKVENEKITKWK